MGYFIRSKHWVFAKASILTGHVKADNPWGASEEKALPLSPLLLNSAMYHFPIQTAPQCLEGKERVFPLLESEQKLQQKPGDNNVSKKERTSPSKNSANFRPSSSHPSNVL